MQITTRDKTQWSQEQTRIIEILVSIRKQWKNSLLDYLVIDALSWHRKYNHSKKVKQLAGKVIDSIQVSADLFCLRAVVRDEQREAYRYKKNPIFDQDLTKVERSSGEYHEFYFKAGELFVSSYRNYSKAVEALLKLLSYGKGIKADANLMHLFAYLGERNPQYAYGLASIIIEKYSDSELANQLSELLAKVRQKLGRKSLALVSKIMEKNKNNMTYELLRSYCRFDLNSEPASEDILLLQSFIESPDEEIKKILIPTFGYISMSSHELAISNLMKIELGDSTELAKIFCRNFLMFKGLLEKLTESQVKGIFHKLIPVQEIGDHEISHFLKKISVQYPYQLVEFLLERFRMSQQNRDAYYQPYPLYEPLDLSQIAETQQYHTCLRTIIEFGLHSNSYFLPHFWSDITKGYENSSISFIDNLIGSDIDKLELGLSLLRHAPKRVFFEEHKLIEKVLNACMKLKPEEYDKESHHLSFDSMHFHVRTRGVVSLEDKETMRKAEETKELFPVGSLAYGFFQNLEEEAQKRMKEDMIMEDDD